MPTGPNHFMMGEKTATASKITSLVQMQIMATTYTTCIVAIHCPG